MITPAEPSEVDRDEGGKRGALDGGKLIFGVSGAFNGLNGLPVVTGVEDALVLEEKNEVVGAVSGVLVGPNRLPVVMGVEDVFVLEEKKEVKGAEDVFVLEENNEVIGAEVEPAAVFDASALPIVLSSDLIGGVANSDRKGTVFAFLACSSRADL